MASPRTRVGEVAGLSEQLPSRDQYGYSRNAPSASTLDQRVHQSPTSPEESTCDDKTRPEQDQARGLRNVRYV